MQPGTSGKGGRKERKKTNQGKTGKLKKEFKVGEMPNCKVILEEDKRTKYKGKRTKDKGKGQNTHYSNF